MQERLNPNQPRILDLSTGQDGEAFFTINQGVSSADVFATLEFVCPDANMRQKKQEKLLELLVDEHKVLAGRTVVFERTTLDNSEAAIIRQHIEFGEQARMVHVRDALAIVHGTKEESAAHCNTLLASLIDSGNLGEMRVRCKQLNEFALADDASIAEEMDDMITEQGGEGDRS